MSTETRTKVSAPARPPRSCEVSPPTSLLVRLQRKLTLTHLPFVPAEELVSTVSKLAKQLNNQANAHEELHAEFEEQKDVNEQLERKSEEQERKREIGSTLRLSLRLSS